jgi:hypothetical protein
MKRSALRLLNVKVYFESVVFVQTPKTRGFEALKLNIRLKSQFSRIDEHGYHPFPVLMTHF